MTGYGTSYAFVDDIRLGNNISPVTMVTSGEKAIDRAVAKAVMEYIDVYFRGFGCSHYTCCGDEFWWRKSKGCTCGKLK